MATSGEFRFLTIGLLLVVVGLTGAEIEIATSGKLPCEETVSEEEECDEADAPKQGHVYLIEEVNQDASAPTNFKVGHTVNPKTRLTDLQTGNPRN